MESAWFCLIIWTSYKYCWFIIKHGLSFFFLLFLFFLSFGNGGDEKKDDNFSARVTPKTHHTDTVFRFTHSLSRWFTQQPLTAVFFSNFCLYCLLLVRRLTSLSCCCCLASLYWFLRHQFITLTFHLSFLFLVFFVLFYFILFRFFCLFSVLYRYYTFKLNMFKKNK